MAESRIEWTDSTWNPLTGCTKISEGCANCYAERMANRLKAMGAKNYDKGFALQIHEDVFDLPLSWKKPQRIFLCSMSDLFHASVPDDVIFRLFDVMNRADWHTFQILTKRSERLMNLSPQLPWTDNIWAGVSVENENYTFRIDHLRSTDAKIKFLSCEPLIGPIPNINLENIDWVIVGGESGPRARPIEKAWVDEIKEIAVKYGVPFYFKQWGGTNKKKTGRTLDGQIWSQMPSVLQAAQA